MTNASTSPNASGTFFMTFHNYGFPQMFILGLWLNRLIQNLINSSNTVVIYVHILNFMYGKNTHYQICGCKLHIVMDAGHITYIVEQRAMSVTGYKCV